MSSARKRIYFDALSEYDLETVKAAVTASIRQPGRAFMPKPGELIDLIPDDTANLAWARVDFAIRTSVNKNGVSFADPVIGHAINKVGGWARLSNSSGKQLDDWIRPEFIKAYNDLKNKGLPLLTRRWTDYISCEYVTNKQRITQDAKTTF